MSDKPLTDVCFTSFDLHPTLLAGLESAGFTRCTPIQALTLPLTLTGRDVAGQAQTGTGKTLAFLVTVIDRLLKKPALADRKAEDPRALILAPTRELAIQIHKDAVKFGSELGIKFALVYGGVDYDKQRQILQAGADVIIATPGRLIDYVKQHKVVSLHACEICVLDEADRMFDLGFIKDIRFLLRRMPERTVRQTLLFSATLSHRVLELAYEHMNEPEKIVVESEFITAAKVRQKVYYPSDEEKIPLLLALLSRSEGARTMVFVNTKAFVERVARALERGGYRVGVLSGDVPQKKRESLLKKFQAGQLEILVATDVAARGLHIDGVSHVYNYDLPFDAEDYVHRIGRTARLGAEGDAISFACERYAMSLPDIEAYIEQKLPTEQVTADMLVALPRTPRAKVEGEEEESVSAIFREAREQKAEDDARRGIKPRSGSTSRTGTGREGERRPPRAPKPPGAAGAVRRVPAEQVEATVVTADVVEPGVLVEAVQVAVATPKPPRIDPVTGEELAPRKRRRRRRGKPVDGADTGDAAAQSSASSPEPRGDRPTREVRPTRTKPHSPRAKAELEAAQSAPAERKPGLISRVARGLKALVTRAPRNQH